VPTPISLVAHLYRRAGFGATVDQLEQLSQRSWEDLVNGLVSAQSEGEPDAGFAQDASLASWERGVAARRWWMQRMLTTSSPLVEKMTLFWHGHFCSGIDKTGFPQMWGQHRVFRSMALGDFRALTKAVSLDPAMVHYLDNDTNRAGSPQENFARELWELMMLGTGHYTQAEVIDSARAWTGHSLGDWYEDGLVWTTHYKFKPNWHDNGAKTIFGRTENFDGPDVIDWTLDGPKGDVCATFIARKFCSFFAYPNPPQAFVGAVATSLKNSNWNIREAMRTLLMHPEFQSPAAQTGLVRSPTEFMVAAIRSSGLPFDQVNPEWYDQAMGQQLLEPPDISGWKQNGYWISTSAFSTRANFVHHLLWKLSKTSLLADLEDVSPETAETAVFRQFELLDPSPGTVAVVRRWIADARARKSWAERIFLIALVMLSPDFQLA
jgi:uncharacterized protein (DUF1800 family)